MTKKSIPWMILLLLTLLSINIASAEVPPVPVNFTNTSGNFWINWTWQAGSGNTTDLYNVSVNGTWTNTSANNWTNVTVAPHGWSNITIFAYNSSGAGNISATSYSGTKQIPNNNPVQTAIGAQTGTENVPMSITITSTDVDEDVLTYSTNATYGTLSTNVFTWTPALGTAGSYIWYFTTTDNQSIPGTDTEDVSITIYEYLAGGAGYYPPNGGGGGIPYIPTITPTAVPQQQVPAPAGILPTESESGIPTTAIYIGGFIAIVMLLAYYGLSLNIKPKPRSRIRRK